MKVCMVATDFPVKREGASVTYGGAGACMAQLVRGLTGVGVEVTLVTRKEKGEYSEIFNVPVYRTPYMDFGLRESKITHAATVLPTLLKVVRNEKFDVIHSHNPPASLPAIVASKRYGIPHVTTMHGPWADVRLSRLGRFFCRIIEKRALKHADQVTCDSKKLAEEDRKSVV